MSFGDGVLVGVSLSILCNFIGYLIHCHLTFDHFKAVQLRKTSIILIGLS